MSSSWGTQPLRRMALKNICSDGYVHVWAMPHKRRQGNSESLGICTNSVHTCAVCLVVRPHVAERYG